MTNQKLFGISYFVSTKLIDLTVEGFNQLKNVMIISEKHQKISEVLMLELGKGVTILSAKGGYSNNKKDVILVVVTRFDIIKIKKIVTNIDKNAFVIINDVHEVLRGRIRHK